MKTEKYEFNGIWTVTGQNGEQQFLPLWSILRQLNLYGQQPLQMQAEYITFSDVAQLFIDKGHVLLCGQEVPVFVCRDHAGEIIGIEVRIGRNPPQYTTIADPAVAPVL